ncbi:MAG: hypothetical protein K0S32_775 [Bacteroidetes bacterium]|nr:hypothetical protein [Bacteroidota bacterium]
MTTIEVWDNGIVFFNLDDHAMVELADSKQNFEALKSLYDGTNKFKVLVETGRYTDISKEAREYSSKPEVNYMTRASAVIVKSLAHRIIINFMINFTNQQNMKMRMFDNKEKAIQWLLKLK